MIDNNRPLVSHDNIVPSVMLCRDWLAGCVYKHQQGGDGLMMTPIFYRPTYVQVQMMQRQITSFA